MAPQWCFENLTQRSEKTMRSSRAVSKLQSVGKAGSAGNGHRESGRSAGQPVDDLRQIGMALAGGFVALGVAIHVMAAAAGPGGELGALTIHTPWAAAAVMATFSGYAFKRSLE